MTKTYCWSCGLRGSTANPVIDDAGQCKRCQTNLIKHPKKIPYPQSLHDNEILARQVLGYREKCDVRPSNKPVTQCNGHAEQLEDEQKIFDTTIPENTIGLTNNYYKKQRKSRKEIYEGWNYNEHKDI